MNIGGVEDRYANIDQISMNNFEEASNEVLNLLEYNQSHPLESEADVELYRSMGQSQIIGTHLGTVIREIERIYTQIPNPSAEDRQIKRDLISHISSQFIPLAESVDRVCNEAMQRIRTHQQRSQSPPVA